jgi:hypothetical protein
MYRLQDIRDYSPQIAFHTLNNHSHASRQTVLLQLPRERHNLIQKRLTLPRRILCHLIPQMIDLRTRRRRRLPLRRLNPANLHLQKELWHLNRQVSPVLLMPASVARYTFKLSWKRCKSVLASGVAVANSWSAKARGDWLEREKSMLLKDTAPLETSGTEERVFAVAEQVTVFASELATSATSAGRVVVPTMKQALFWRVERARGEARVRARRVVRVSVVESIVVVCGVEWI